ncbi:MAG: hypothetical protein ACI8S7_001979 [Candidatus Krumholzibacteriia bacterium]
MVVLFLLAISGCSGKVSRLHYAEDFDPLANDDAKYAIGGFVLSTLAELDRQAEIGTDEQIASLRFQTDTWAPAIYGPFLAGRRGIDVWSWSALRENIPADTITQVQLDFSRGEVVQPSLLKLVAADLPDITYLVLARIDENEVSISRSLPDVNNRIGLDNNDARPPADSLGNTAKSRRTVKMTLEVYDLRSGRSVWRGDVKREITELLAGDAMIENQDLVVTPSEEEDGLPEIEVNSASVKFPLLDNVLADACAALVSDLFAIEPDGENDE